MESPQTVIKKGFSAGGLKVEEFTGGGEGDIYEQGDKLLGYALGSYNQNKEVRPHFCYVVQVGSILVCAYHGGKLANKDIITRELARQYKLAKKNIIPLPMSKNRPDLKSCIFDILNN